MAKDEKSRQKKLARKAAKRKAKQQQIRAAGSLSKVELAARQSRKPVYGCVVPVGLFETGIGSVVFARGDQYGEIAMVVFLVDVWCLGIKNAFYKVGDFEDYQVCLQAASEGGPLEEWEPACVKKLVTEMIAWAQELGLSPHPDSRMGLALIGEEVDASQCSREFHFGKDGKPMFMAGPNDDTRRCRQIIETLERRVGAGQYNYILPMGPGMPPPMLDAQEGELIEGELDEPPPKDQD